MSKELNELRSQTLKPGTTGSDNTSFHSSIEGSLSSIIPSDDFSLSFDAVNIGHIIVSAEAVVQAFKM